MFKYEEDKLLKEIYKYIEKTYEGHYSNGQVQTLDIIESVGDAEAFCRSNILKYASRYDKKGSARQDLLKVLHYGILLMHFHTKRAQAQSDADWAAQDY